MKCWNIFSGHAGQYWNMTYPNDGGITDSEAKRYLSEITCGNNRDFNASLSYNDNKVIISSISRYFSAGVAMETKHIIVAKIDKALLENRYSNLLSFGFVPGDIISKLYNNPELAQQVIRKIPDIAENFNDVEVSHEALREILYVFIEKIRLGEADPVYIMLPELNDKEYFHFCKAVINRIIACLPIGLIPKTSFSIFPSQKDKEYSFVFVGERDGDSGSLRIDRPVNIRMEDKRVQYMVDIFINNPNLFEKIDDRYAISDLTVSKYMDFMMLYLWQNEENVDCNLLKEWNTKLRVAVYTDDYYKTVLENTISQCLSRSGFTSETLNRMLYDENIKTYGELNSFLAPYTDILMYLASNGITLSTGLLENYYNNILKNAESVFGNGEQLYDNLYKDLEDNRSNIEKSFSIEMVDQVDALLRNNKTILKSKAVMSTIQKMLAHVNSFAEVANILDDKSEMYQEIDIKIDGQTVEDLIDRLIKDKTSYDDWENGARALDDYEKNRVRLDKYLEEVTMTEIENYVDSVSEEFYKRCAEEGTRQVRNFSRRDQFINLLCRCGGLRDMLPSFDIANSIVEKYTEYICSSPDFDENTYRNYMELLEQFQNQYGKYGVDYDEIERIKEEVRQRNQERQMLFNSRPMSLKKEKSQENAAVYSNYSSYGDDQILRGDRDTIPWEQSASYTNTDKNQELSDKNSDGRRDKIIKSALIAGSMLIMLAIGFLAGFFIGKNVAKRQQKDDLKGAIATSSDAINDSLDYSSENTDFVTESTSDIEKETEVTTEKNNLNVSTEDTETVESTTEDSTTDKTLELQNFTTVLQKWKDGQVVAAFTEIKESCPMKDVIIRMQGDQVTADEYGMLEQYLVADCIMNDDAVRQDDVFNAVYVKCCPDIAAYIENDASYVTYPIVAVSKNNSQEIDVYYFDGDEYEKADKKDLAELDIAGKLKNGSSPNQRYSESIDNSELNKVLSNNFSALLKVFND